jgi:hypothetical protein
MAGKGTDDEPGGSSVAGRGGAGAYIEGELGAYYLLEMLAGGEARGLPGAHIERVRFQGAGEGFALDDLVVHGRSARGPALLEIQSKRTIQFSPRDSLFAEVCGQIAKVTVAPGVPEDRHLLAVATQRTSFRISGPYQDVLAWARSADTAASFFGRLGAKGLASQEMRDFVTTFRSNLVAHGVADDEALIWRFLRRFQVLEFDFESSAPQARTYSLALARLVLAPEDADRTGALWSSLIELALGKAKIGGFYDCVALRDAIVGKGFRLAGDRNYSLARAKLDETARFALRDIGTDVSGLQLPRSNVIASIDEARDRGRFIDIRGGPGVGKSAVLRQMAERVLREGRAIVLDPVRTPDGGWSGLAQSLGVVGTARDFLTDLAASGGAVLFIDGLEMFGPGKRRTVNDVLREASDIEGFSVIATARPDFGADEDSWLAHDAMTAFGPIEQVSVGELDDAEVAILSDHAPELRALLAPGHPAAQIARNLYRLSRLLKVPSTAVVRTEAALAAHWWATGDGIEKSELRPAQRIFSDLADAAIGGRDTVLLREDPPARAYLLGTLSLRETKRDQLAFYHDVLRDWAVGMHLYEDPSLVAKLDLSLPVSATLARGIEFAGRLALELGDSADKWLGLLNALSTASAHGSWRRHALMAIVRSELSPILLERHGAIFLKRGGALLRELANAIIAVDTISTAELFSAVAGQVEGLPTSVPATMRTAVTHTARRLTKWCVAHSSKIPLQALSAVIRLTEIQMPLMVVAPNLAEPVAHMLFDWLLQLDVRGKDVTIPVDESVEPLERSSRSRLVEDLRTSCLLLAASAPDKLKTYLSAVAAEENDYKVKAIRPLSKIAATVTPRELAELIEQSLIERPERGASTRRSYKRGFSHADTDYMPPSPAQPPFLDLLQAAPDVGLALIRRLTKHAVAHHTGGGKPGDNGFTLVFDDGLRFFPWTQSYFWSRGHGNDYAVASGLMALEAWGHQRIEAGEPIDAVLNDVLGPDGSCAAYLMVAVDLLISHWPATREALVPFVSSPELLASERQRDVFDRVVSLGFDFQKEPPGPVQLEHLRARPSRGIQLERVLLGYLSDDQVSAKVRKWLKRALDRLGAFEEDDDFGDPAFMGAYALNLLNADNWVAVEGGQTYRSPPEEAEHLGRMQAKHAQSLHGSEVEAKIHLAISDRDRGSAEVARDAFAYAEGDLPDDSDPDVLKSRSTRLVATAMLIARDGDDSLLDEHESWVRQVIERALAEDSDRPGPSDRLEFNRPAMATCALIHLWRRRGQASDRDALVRIAGRDDRCGAPAFAATLDEILAADARVLKSALRVAFATLRWRWHRWDEDPSEAEAYEHEKKLAGQQAIASEIAWLNGGPEPAWRSLPDEAPTVRRRSRISQSTDDGQRDGAIPAASPRSETHANSQAIAAWLKIAAVGEPEWIGEVIDAYSDWSARLNGFDMLADSELDRTPQEWNTQFYALAVPVALSASEERFEEMLRRLEGLPDQPFCDVAESVLHAADVWYFNHPDRSAERPVRLRTRMAERVRALRRWNWNFNPGDLSIDYDTGGVVAKLFMNTHNPFVGTTSYLVPGVFDRIDPLLETLRPLLPGGPTTFVALCAMNTLMVAPRARHADFVLSALEVWLERLQTDPTMWIELGIGRRAVEWLLAASSEEPGLLTPDHLLRGRMDAVLGRLIALGVPEAHELERRIEERRTAVLAERQ